MANDILRKDLKSRSRQLEWLIIAMAGTTLASLQIIRYCFLNSTSQITLIQTMFDWVFAMLIIGGLVHFSFREIYKIQNELIEKRELANRSERRLQHILDTTQDAIFTIDKEGYFTFASRSIEPLTGYEMDAILNRNIRDVLSSEYSSFLFKQLNETKDIAGQHFFIDALRQNGDLVPIEVSFVPIKDRSGQVLGFQGIARDITERKEVEKAHREKERYLQTIAKVGQTIIETTEEVPYKAILEELSKATDSQHAFVLLNVAKSSIDASFDAEPSSTSNTSLSTVTNNIPRIFVYDRGSTAREDKNTFTDNGYTSKTRSSENHGMVVDMSQFDSAFVAIPIIVEGKPVGTIGFTKSKDSDKWKSAHINLLTTAANMISQEIEREHINLQLKRHFISLARTLSKALFVIDPYTASHQERSAMMACKVGEKIGINPKKLEWLYFCGLLHDVGKAAIPGSILSKPGQLTDEEWVLIRSHVKRGCEILQSMTLPDDVRQTIMQHHERLDGSGYPDGISGEKLNLGARILGVCDVVEAMSSHRPYRPARSRDEIVSELRKGKGQKYDSQVVDLVVNMMDSHDFNCSGSLSQCAIAPATG
jgi:PAS domain S-box-containing protein/putative nucleotidyltransferase with HDIG domain